MQFKENTPVQEITLKEIANYPVKLLMKRDDLLHSKISGNKWRKLKYNLQYAQDNKLDTVLTFGGAYSNHIAATAAAGKEFGLRTIGVIRGEEDRELNQTLKEAAASGMMLHFISRSEYRRKKEAAFIEELKSIFGEFHLLPEGGSNKLAVKGCGEILDEECSKADVVCCAVGTGGTLAGLAISKQNHQRLIGFPALKDAIFLKEEVNELIADQKGEKELFELDTAFHFGGYAKITEELVQFTRRFYDESKIKLDLIYTAKLMFGVIERIKMGQFDNLTIVVIHTGGLQGNEGMVDRYNLGELF